MDVDKKNYTVFSLAIEDEVLKDIKKVMWAKDITGNLIMADEQAWCFILNALEKGHKQIILRKKE